MFRNFKMIPNFFNNIIKSIRCISSHQYSQSTIYSLSSGHGKCGVSIIRVSGPNSKYALTNLIDKTFNPKPRFAYLKPIYHPKTGSMIDNGLVLWFPGPKSFTGEDCCEFQVHGSIAVINSMMEALSTISEFRLAKPGEYTKRSFYNGKLDLIEAEGLADLIHAETESQRKQALLQSTGALSKIYGQWRTKIIRNVAHLEAYIDFAEDENIEDNTLEEIYFDLNLLMEEIRRHLDDGRRGEILRNGVRTVIIGSPNVGKSSFMNLICQRDISIVTSKAGTTRDIIETSINIDGYPVVFADTAGLRLNTNDEIEAEGINRAINYIKSADFIVILLDAITLVESLHNNNSLDDYIKFYMKSLNINLDILSEKKILSIVNKIDLVSKNELTKIIQNKDLSFISCKTNENLDKVLSKIGKYLEQICGQPTAENPHLTKARHRQNLNECVNNLEIFLQSYQMKSVRGNIIPIIDMNQDLAILAQKLRKAVRNIEEITGNIRTDDILDVIFKDFCIGK